MDFSSVTAILFDLDGVLANSTPVVEQAWRAWSVEHGLDADYVLSLAHGRRKTEILAIVAPHLDAAHEVERLLKLEEEGMHALMEVPGAAEIVSRLPAGTWAIGTSGERAGALFRLRKVGIVPPPVLIAAEDVQHGKPQPEVYLRAAAGLGVAPEECLVFEDAPLGVDAALAAGMRVIGLSTTYPASALHLAHSVGRDFRDVEIAVARSRIESIHVDGTGF